MFGLSVPRQLPLILVSFCKRFGHLMQWLLSVGFKHIVRMGFPLAWLRKSMCSCNVVVVDALLAMIHWTGMLVRPVVEVFWFDVLSGSSGNSQDLVVCFLTPSY